MFNLTSCAIITGRAQSPPAPHAHGEIKGLSRAKDSSLARAAAAPVLCPVEVVRCVNAGAHGVASIIRVYRILPPVLFC
jgi:hypothetical protein